MNQVIGEILPYALVIAFSPIPIIAVVLILLSPTAGKTGLGFLLAWIAGISCVTTAFIALANVLPESTSESQPIAGTIKLILAGAFFYLAGKKWQARPTGEQEPQLPSWMEKVDSFTFTKGFKFGILLSAANPKNLILGAAAGVAISDAQLGASSTVGVVAIFVALASLTIAIPVFSYIVAADRMRAPLNSLEKWLRHNNSTVMFVLLLFIGVLVLGKAIASF